MVAERRYLRKANANFFFGISEFLRVPQWTGHGRVRQLAEWPLSFCPSSRSVAYWPSAVKMPGYERAADMGALPVSRPNFTKPTHTSRGGPRKATVQTA